MRQTVWGLMILLMGCATGHQQSAPSYHFTVSIPEGWEQVDTDKYFLITKDGAYQQYAMIQERPIDRAFAHTKKKLQWGMLPQEAAEVIIDEIASDSNISNFQVLENTPASIKGYEGFRLVFTYRDTYGAVFKTLYYGFIKEGVFYNLRYNAGQKDYFEKDLPTFEKFVESFRFIKI